MEELKPCPFCGHAPNGTSEVAPFTHAVVCLNCEIAGPTAISKECAINYWNKRVCSVEEK